MPGRGIVIEIVGDERSYLRAAERTIATNTKLDSSFKQVGVNANLSADAQIKAAVKAQEAMRANATALASRASSLPTGSREQVVATALAADAQAKYSRSLGVTRTATTRLSGETKTAENDLNKLTRGALAGSGVFSSMGRSLAFASTAFIGFSVGGLAISTSIKDAESLDAALRSVDVTITKMGGSVRTFNPELEKWAGDQQRLGVSTIDATKGFATLLAFTHDATTAREAYTAALEISRVTGRSLSTVELAAAKATQGQTTALARYIGTIPKGTSFQEEFNRVQAKFGGQALANTTVSDRFSASLTNTETVLGTALLPTFDQYLGDLDSWLSKSKNQQAIVHDVTGGIHALADAFKVAVGVVRTVDKVTGSFKNTLELLLAIKLASTVTSWVGALTTLAGKWGLVTDAATTAGAAQETAFSSGGVAGAAGATEARAAAGGALGLSSVAIAAIVAAVAYEFTKSSAFKSVQQPAQSKLGPAGFLLDSGSQIWHGFERSARNASTAVGFLLGEKIWDGFSVGLSKAEKTVGANVVPRAFQPLTGFGAGRGGGGGSSGPFGSARPQHQFTQAFSLTSAEQLAQSQAQLTKSTADDVAAARQVVSRIKRLIDQGRLHGQALVQALGLEATALSTIWAAEDAAAQARAQKAAAARARIKARIAAAIQNSIDPLGLEVALSRDQALGRSTTKDLKALRAAAERAIKSGNLNLEQQKEAYDQITSINAQLKSQTTTAAAAFKQASTKALTSGLDLTAAQRKALRQRLSQLGPGGTVASQGTGAYGFDIGSGGTVVVHHTTKLDGKTIEQSTTKHQQKRRRRNAVQSRGPHAGVPAA